MQLRPALLVIAACAAITGCSGMNRGGKWPTLAPRPGEVSPLVPRTPLGACAGCGQDVAAAPVVAPAPAPVLPPADAGQRLDAVAAAIAEVEKAVPAQRRATDAAVASARGAAPDSNVAIDAELQKSRLEALFVPLDVQARALDALEDDLAGTSGDADYRVRIGELRARLAALEETRRG